MSTRPRSTLGPPAPRSPRRMDRCSQRRSRAHRQASPPGHGGRRRVTGFRGSTCVDASTAGCPRDTCSGSPGAGSMRERLGAVMALPIRCCGASIRPRGTADPRERPICGKETRGQPTDVVPPRRRGGESARGHGSARLQSKGSSASAPRCNPSVSAGVGTKLGIAHSILQKTANAGSSRRPFPQSAASCVRA
jgi:hypothetical protein